NPVAQQGKVVPHSMGQILAVLAPLRSFERKNLENEDAEVGGREIMTGSSS
ncbi:hypothetical protein ACO22_06836, partial [Paracoccidioides brasiliensis]